MKKLISITVLMLMVVMGVMASGCGNRPSTIYSTERVIVIFTEDASLLDKEWATSDFPGFAFSKIHDIGLIGSQRFLGFYLAEPSRSNMNRAVNYLRSRSEVYWAEPDSSAPGD